MSGKSAIEKAVRVEAAGGEVRYWSSAEYLRDPNSLETSGCGGLVANIRGIQVFKLALLLLVRCAGEGSEVSTYYRHISGIGAGGASAAVAVEGAVVVAAVGSIAAVVVAAAVTRTRTTRTTRGGVEPFF